MSEKCCPADSAAALSTTYQPKGVEIDLDGLKCYTNGKGGKSIIVFYDIFGYNGGRTKQICDQIADEGYYVILPDIYDGDFWPADKPIQPEPLSSWFKGFPWILYQKERVDKVMAHLQEKGADQSIGCIGFCAGALSVFHLCANEKLKCGASCHPSVQLAGLFGSSPEALAKEIRCPQLLYPASGDLATYKKGGEVFSILQEKFADKFVAKEFVDMAHGWVSRGDIKDPKIAADVKSALDGVLSFFKANM